jgi:hypothetical protein
MNSPKASGLIVPSREFINEQQATVILASLREVGMWMAKSEDLVPGEARVAAENTFIKICDRLEKIIDEEARWSMTGATNFYDELVETQKAQQEFLSTQTAAASLVLRPSYIHRPTLMRDGISFYAVWGDSSIPGGAIIGVGATPNAALADFDAAFDRAPKDQVNLILETENSENPEIPPQAPNEES